MEENKPELRQCTRCHSSCTLEHFELNRKGELFKLCNNCRGKWRERADRTRRSFKIMNEQTDAMIKAMKEKL